MNLPEDKLIEIWNTFCCDTHRSDGYVFYNTPKNINSLFESAWDVVRFVGKYNRNDKYFRLTAWGDIESFPTVSDDFSPVYLNILIDWIVKEEKEDII